MVRSIKRNHRLVFILFVLIPIPGQARKFLQSLSKVQFESKPFYQTRFFHLNNYVVGVWNNETKIFMSKIKHNLNHFLEAI